MAAELDSKALPCPFCGGEPEDELDSSPAMFAPVTLSRVGCDECRAYGPFAESEALAISAWNRRAALPAPAAGREGGEREEKLAEAWHQAFRKLADSCVEHFGHLPGDYDAILADAHAVDENRAKEFDGDVFKWLFDTNAKVNAAALPAPRPREEGTE